MVRALGFPLLQRFWGGKCGVIQAHKVQGGEATGTRGEGVRTGLKKHLGRGHVGGVHGQVREEKGYSTCRMGRPTRGRWW